MIKFIYCIRKRSDVEREVFRDFITEALLVKLNAAVEAGVMSDVKCNLTLNLELNDQIRDKRGHIEAYDAVIVGYIKNGYEFAKEIWGGVDDIKLDQEQMSMEKKFIDHGLSSLFFCEEVCIT